MIETLTGLPMALCMHKSACWNGVRELKSIVVSPQTQIALIQLNNAST